MTRPFTIRAFAALLLIFSLTLVMVHWHTENTGQDCGLCAAHQMPSLQSTTQAAAAAPRVVEWRQFSKTPSFESSAFVPAHAGRAPPALSN